MNIIDEILKKLNEHRDSIDYPHETETDHGRVIGIDECIEIISQMKNPLSELLLPIINDPNCLGEVLRDKFFAQIRTGDIFKQTFGCYDCFEYRNDVISLPDILDENLECSWHCAKLDDIEMRYYWDGDGTLEFIFPNGDILSNDDCKKNNRWKWYK